MNDKLKIILMSAFIIIEIEFIIFEILKNIIAK